MDRIERTIDVIRALNRYNTGVMDDYDFIPKVCAYFDYMKGEMLTASDKEFLIHLANKAGIPHYYDMLRNTQEGETLDFDAEDLNVATFSAMLHETSLHTDEKNKLHRFQKQILQRFKTGELNRFFLSASTSFGKTHLTYEIIKSMKYENVILIFPTVALLTENLSRLKEKETYSYFNEQGYVIHTLSDGAEAYGERNIFIFTPERYLSFLDKNAGKIKLNFVFVDEVYKIDNEYMDNDQDEVKEHDRDLAYRMAIYYVLEDQQVDLLLAGPYITFFDQQGPQYNPSFDLFLNHYNITLINRNNYEIVNKSYSVVKTKKAQQIDGIDLDFVENKNNVTSKQGRLRIVLAGIMRDRAPLDRKTIVYCSTKVSVEHYANDIISWNLLAKPQDEYFKLFIDHLERIYHPDWCVTNALKNGVGIHHGVVPKYIQKEIIRLFNTDSGLTALVCTTTVTEGVNTSAKNLITLSDKKGIKQLKAFDAKNIAGRAGRFMEHFQGSVITIQNAFDKVIAQDDGGIRHKNFDVTLTKVGADLDMTGEEYLGETGRERKIRIDRLQQERNIPDEIISLFKTISREDKITVFDRILQLDSASLDKITKFIEATIINRIDFDGMQVVIDVFYPIVLDSNFLFLLNKSTVPDEQGNPTEREHSRIIFMLYYYLKDGFDGLFNYRVNSLKETVDTAMRKASELVYNTFKYQLVKYLGVFNTMYKYRISLLTHKPIDEVQGLDRLITKLEYNAFSDRAKIASDYGVPQRIIDYYDGGTEAAKNRIFNSFDPFEKHVFDSTRKLFE
jgi:late competence protein required for DNA uptake (superfamily II DNA/RNA helicase)